jgi:hypothetical protein
MADITMCRCTECKHIHKCFRFLAKPSTYQSYAGYHPDEDGECEAFWEVPNGKLEKMNKQWED